MSDLLVREVRVVPLDPTTRVGTEPVDVLVRDGHVRAVGPHLSGSRFAQGVPVLEGEGRWVVPGLWDHHVHMIQWALSRVRLDTGACTSMHEVLELVRLRIDRGVDTPTGVVVGFGHRPGFWTDRPTVAALDAVSGDVPVVLIAGDAHHGWLNTAALRLLHGPMVPGIVAEAEWYPLFDRLADLPGADQEAEEAVVEAIRDAHRKGVVGVTDLEFGHPWDQWYQRVAAGTEPLRVRAGVYPEGLDEVLARGLRTGVPLHPDKDLVLMGPLKIITDGSLNTRTAWCCQPYEDTFQHDLRLGAPNLPADELYEIVRRGTLGGLHSALHAIGDAAVRLVLKTFEATGARGAIEHAQLIDPADLDLWGRLPVRASVQPAHLLDDREMTELCWPDRTGRTFTLASFREAGVEMVLGSDAPVAPLDPWLAIAAAVHRGEPDRESWHPEQQLTAQEALRSSVDRRRVVVGAPGDLVVLDADPLADFETSGEQAAHLRAMRVAATVIAGQQVHGA